MCFMLIMPNVLKKRSAFLHFSNVLLITQISNESELSQEALKSNIVNSLLYGYFAIMNV